MTAASVAQRHMGLKASIWDNEGVPSALVSNEFSRGLWPSKHAREIHWKVQRCSQGRAQGGDQAPLAAIARVSAAKSETWSLVLCLPI